MHPALLRALELLCRELPARKSQIRNAHIQPVGRNCVWRICVDATRGFVYYAKHVPSVDWFAREVFGHSVSRRLSVEHPSWIMAADVVATDSSVPLILTRGIAGKSLADMFRQSLRRDQNMFGRAASIRCMIRPWRRLHRWLMEFHGQCADAVIGIHDHSPRGIRNRLRIKTQLIRDVGYGVLAERCEQTLDDVIRYSDIEIGNTLTYGDCTLGNFFWHDGRIGAIEFEDIGIGRARRDWISVTVK